MRNSLLFTLLVAFGPALSSTPQDNPVGFLEDFALAPDRAEVLKQLAPGTAESYFYHCLERQHAGELDAVDRLLETWVQRHGRGGRVEEIENRQALLRVGEQPAKSYAFLRQRLQLAFNHKREVPGEEAQLPVSLEQKRISEETLTKRALSRHNNGLRGFEDSRLLTLDHKSLGHRARHELLTRLWHPDLDGLAALVVRDLNSKYSSKFGSLGIHGRLLLEQLDECLRIRPALLNQEAFVAAYLARLAPDDDLDWSHDAQAREAYIERLWAFVQKLAPVHNSLKAHVLSHWLHHDRALGRVDRGRFLTWLKLPRRASWVNPDYLRRHRNEEVISGSDQEPTLLGRAGDDEELLRDLLEHFFKEDADYAEFEALVSDVLLKRIFAETKILFGVGDMELWYSLLDDPVYYEKLRQRVEIGFLASQPTRLAAHEPVTIEVNLKNVPTLLVKTFEIDAFAYYRATGREVDASLPLDGLVAGKETTYNFDVNPLRRVLQSFEFPGLDRPGVFVVEFIGGGLSSRAVIQKGHLQLRERRSAAGHAIVVLDENGNRAPGASLFFGGREYKSGAGGEILVPYSTEPKERQVILSSAARCSLDSFQHARENYTLEAGMLVNREALLAGEEAQWLVRPRLRLAGATVDLNLVEDALLSLTSTRADGISSTLEVRDIELLATGEWVQKFQVPPGTVKLVAQLVGRVQSMSSGKAIKLASAPVTYLLNGIEVTDATHAPFLGRDADGWFLEVRGKNGEVRGGVSTNLILKHKDYSDTLTVSLQSDLQGRVHLGALEGIESVRVEGLPKNIGAWHLGTTPPRVPAYLHGVAGGVLRVAYSGTATEVSRQVASLVELRSEHYTHDRCDHMVLEGGYLELRNLPAGNFELLLQETNQRVAVRISAGEPAEGWALGRDRWLELSTTRPLQLDGLRVEGDSLVVAVQGATDATRLHIMTARYLSPYDSARNLAFDFQRTPKRHQVLGGETEYRSGRTISDEYRYVLERRFAEKFPGNMLERPQVLLNPWAVDYWNRAIGLGGGAGGRFGGRTGKARKQSGGGANAAPVTPTKRAPGTFGTLDFLPAASWILANQKPDEDGLLRIPLADLGPGQSIVVLAVDRGALVEARLSLPWQGFEPLDRRLVVGLDPERHRIEQRRIDFLSAGQSATVKSATPETVEIYDSLDDIYRLFRTRRPNSGLGRFAFLLEWPDLDEKRKRELYSDFACHELHLFLWNKDREFFDSVALPFLNNKAERTFIDHWLLGADLSGYTEPWAFADLNVMERALLAQRLKSRAAAVTRQLREWVALDPTKPQERARLFEEILLGSALELEEEEVVFDESASAEQRAARGPSTPGPSGLSAAVTARRNGLESLEFASDKEEGNEAKSGSDDFFLGLALKEVNNLGRDARLRQEVRGLHIEMRATERFVESNYWQRTSAEAGASLLSVHEFWLDFASVGPDQPFVSTNFPLATGHLNEMLLALALLDLPFKSAEHTVSASQGSVEINAASGLLLVRKELVESRVSGDAPRVLVAQNLFRLDERHVMQDGQRVEAFVNGDLEVGVAYGCRVVLTNPTLTPHEFEVLLQIPRGALPLLAGRFTRGVPLAVGAHGTTSLEYAFYFPEPGSFAHYPVHVAEDGALVAFAKALQLTVVREPSKLDESSWEHISQLGTQEAVLAYMDATNLQALDLQSIAWRMSDAAFFGRTLEFLRERFVYNNTLWSYGLRHGDSRAAGEYLRHADGFIDRCGAALNSPLLDIDPVLRRAYERVEYMPLVNARAHAFSGRREITNVDVKNQYRRFLNILCHRAVLDDLDWMSVSTFMLLQDRVGEARAAFARVDPSRLEARIQYDYLAAYLDFYSRDHNLARSLAAAYQDHPLPHWRNRFRAVLRHLDEAQARGQAATGDDPTSSEALVAREPALELNLEGETIFLRHEGLDSCELRFYALDVEFLFSTSPFVEEGESSFSFVQPNHREPVELDPAGGEFRMALPPDFSHANVLIEVRGGGIVRREARYANSLSVRVIEAHGQLKVESADTGAPLQSVYIKVYVREDGKVRFHKDGYTDLRGRFDYISVSGSQEAGIESIAILILSPTDGAVIREAAPPAR